MLSKLFKIGTQLKIGFLFILIFVILLGMVSQYHSNKLHEQIEIINDHPIKVRNALSIIKVDILRIRVEQRNLMLATNETERNEALFDMNIAEKDAYKQFEIVKDYYLGPKTDVEKAYNSFVKWNTYRERIKEINNSQDVQNAKQSTSSSGKIGQIRDQMLAEINLIDQFAENKASSLVEKSNSLVDTLRNQLTIVVSLILVLLIFIYLILLRNITTPIAALLAASTEFQNGNLSARCSYESTNEFGELSKSFNNLVDSIETSTELTAKTVKISEAMLSEDTPDVFFRATLQLLADFTNSQIASIYLMSNDGKKFERHQSIGLSIAAKSQFDIDTLEGELGHAINTKKIHQIKKIPKDSLIILHTTGGDIVPREMLTIPIVSGRKTVAIISLASVRSYDKLAISLIETINDTLSARIQSILSFQKIKEFSHELEAQNRELEAQKIEMSSQSSELMVQNTELEVQKQQLKESSLLKTNFLANMSHELRTPLNSVIALSGVLNRRLEKQIPPEEYSYLEVIERNGKHLLTLINDILDISRIEAGKEDIEISKFDFNDLIADVMGMIAPQALLKEIEFEQLSNEKPILIKTDLGKCRHILQNLIGNAVKFTDSGKVEIGGQITDDKIEIRVKDSGIGIDKTHLDHIFDEFRQADGSTSRRYGGTGLGLAIAKKYANLLGGTIDVKSNLGIGSEFTLSLPLIYSSENRINDTPKFENVNNKPIAIAPQNAIPKSDDSAQKTILLVDDSEPAIIQMKDILEENGYKIYVAKDGVEAMQLLTSLVPDAIILDLMMPEIDGFEVLKGIRNVDETAKVPVLVLTAKHITKEDLNTLKQNNIHQLIQKGDVNLAQLIQTIADMTTLKQPITPAIRSTTTRHEQSKKLNILVVEDNPDNMITVKALLEDKFNVFEAIDGIEAINMAKLHIPHLILMDIALPNVDGIEAFHTIRKNIELENIPIIALTASAMTSDRETILSHGFDAYIAKPIDEKLFLKTIHQILYA
ncbi:MAG: response regulator [Bacteroidales bacterium]